MTAWDQTRVKGDRVEKVDDCRIVLGQTPWPFADENKDAIAAYWQNAVRCNSNFFDGIVLLAAGYRIEGNILDIEVFETRFRNFLYWRDHGFADAAAIDAFGSGVIRAADGGVLLVRQHPGNVNEGLFYFPGGFIDRRDVDTSGRIDIAASIGREVSEELGIDASELTRETGFLVTRTGPHLSIAAVLASPIDGRELLSRISDFLDRESQPEIAEAKLIKRRDDLDGLNLAPYCRPLLGKLLV